MVIIVIMILVRGVMVLVITISIFGTHFGSLYHTIPFIVTTAMVTLVIMLMMPPRTPQDLEKLKPFGTLCHSPANCDNINLSHCRPLSSYSTTACHSRRSRGGFYLDPNSIPGNLVSFVSVRVIFWVRLFKRLALTLTRACNFEIA